MQMTNAHRFNTPSVSRQRVTLMQMPKAKMVHFHSLKQQFAMLEPVTPNVTTDFSRN